MRRVLPFALVLLAACGGMTESSSSSSSSSGTGGSSGGGGGTSSGSSGARSCTALGCENGARIDFSFAGQGTYVVDLKVDGATVVCKVPIPLPRGAYDACSRSDVLLGLVGSELPVSQQSIGGIHFTSEPSSVTLRVQRDSTILGEKTITFAYTVTPGPNGPGCEPKECKLAKASFP